MNKIQIKKNTLTRLGPFVMTCLACACLLVLFFYHGYLIKYPHCLDIGESAHLLPVNLLMNHINPYVLESQPEYTYDYGIAYPLFMYLISKVFANTFFVHRLTVAVFILSTCLLVFGFLKRQKKASLSTILLCVILLYTSLIYSITSTARPDALGFFFYVLSFLIVARSDFSNRGIAWGICFGIIAYLFKMYYLLSVICILSYLLLFRSRKKASIFIIGTGVLLGGILMLIFNKFPLFIYNSFVITSVAFKGDFSFCWYQLEKFMVYYFSLGIIGLLLTVQILRKLSLKLKKKDIDFFLYSFIVALLVFIFKLGKYGGGFLVYGIHLFIPLLIILIATHSHEAKKKLWALNGLILINIMLFSAIYANKYYTFQKTDNNWQLITDFMINKKIILHAPITSHFAIQTDDRVYFTALSKDFICGENYPNCFKYVSPKKSQIRERNQKLINEISHKIQAQYFDGIIYDEFYPKTFVSSDTIQKYYKQVNEVWIYTPHMSSKNHILLFEKRKP